MSEAATEKGFSVELEGGKVTGRDGRKRTATPRKPAPREREPGEDDDIFDRRDEERDRRRREARKHKPPKKDAIAPPASRRGVLGGGLEGAQESYLNSPSENARRLPNG
jgi:hypothetical protein